MKNLRTVPHDGGPHVQQQPVSRRHGYRQNAARRVNSKSALAGRRPAAPACTEVLGCVCTGAQRHTRHATKVEVAGLVASIQTHQRAEGCPIAL
jgi:hypothetical protein